jgi:hypothetical protein
MPEQYRAIYGLTEKLIDFEDCFRRWRSNYATTVGRVWRVRTVFVGVGVTKKSHCLLSALFRDRVNITREAGFAERSDVPFVEVHGPMEAALPWPDVPRAPITLELALVERYV